VITVGGSGFWVTHHTGGKMRLDITITSSSLHKLFEFSIGLGIVDYIKDLFGKKVVAKEERLPEPMHPHEMGFGG
tara:strand:+ start:375 stop:599 length:225 start_codon:yes stop_codon:yes gene_type:complete